jgi:hypothetical protein
MDKIIKYRAYDGTIFNNYEDCAEYERATPRKKYNIIITTKARTGTVVWAYSKEEALAIGKSYGNSVYPDEDWNWDEPTIEVEEVAEIV